MPKIFPRKDLKYAINFQNNGHEMEEPGRRIKDSKQRRFYLCKLMYISCKCLLHRVVGIKCEKLFPEKKKAGVNDS